MSRRFTIRRPRYADVAATLALVFAMSGTAYAVSSFVDPGSVNTAAIVDKAVTLSKLATEAVSTEKIVPGAVTHGKIAANAVTGGDVLNHSLSLADLAGADLTGSIAFTFAAHGCGYLKMNVSGARVGQSAIFTWVGTTNPPSGLVVGPLKVVSAGHIVATGCNLTGHRISASHARVRVTTFG